MDFWDEKNESLDRDEIEQIQLERLQATLNRVYKNVSHYKKVFKELDFMPEDLRSLNELKKLPFITRNDLRDNYPYGMFAVPLREVKRLHAPALTLDKPVVMGFTSNDLKAWAQLKARELTAKGVGKGDVVQVSLTLGKMAGPFGVQLGADLIGASFIPLSGSKLPSQAKIMRDFRTTTLVTTPSFALGLAQTLETLGISPVDLSLERCILCSEPWSEATRQELESRLHISATDSYGLIEVFGPGVAWECPEKSGLHICEDHFIPEIIDPVSGDNVSGKGEGELVLTTISKEAFPLIRFRTGDIASIDYTPCSCGRTHCRISRIFKRSDNIIIMRGTSVTPEHIGQIIETVDKIPTTYQLVVKREDNQDQLVVMVEISDKVFSDEMKRQTELVERYHKALSEFLGWEVTVKLVEPGTLDTKDMVLDERKFL